MKVADLLTIDSIEVLACTRAISSQRIRHRNIASSVLKHPMLYSVVSKVAIHSSQQGLLTGLLLLTCLISDKSKEWISTSRIA